jgi:hypothetical protein
MGPIVHAVSPFCLRIVSFFCFFALGLRDAFSFRAPPRYNQVQANTSANWKMI